MLHIASYLPPSEHLLCVDSSGLSMGTHNRVTDDECEAFVTAPVTHTVGHKWWVLL